MKKMTEARQRDRWNKTQRKRKQNNIRAKEAMEEISKQLNEHDVSTYTVLIHQDTWHSGTAITTGLEQYR